MKPTAQSDRLLIQHMLDCIARIREYTGGERTTFFGSRLVRDAVIRNLQTLAESAQRLSDGLKATEPAIPWRRMAGMRNILVHDYLGGIDLETAWLVIEGDLAPLAEALGRMRGRLPEGDAS
jgi:uncharacterized protein with HEPN domain